MASGSEEGVRVLQYNILAQRYCKEAFLPYVLKPTFRTWKYRSARLTADVSAAKPDLICMQEVDMFMEFWQRWFSQEGFECVYQMRPGKNEGVLVAWKRSRFYQHALEYVLHMNELQGIFNPLDKSYFIRGNVGLVIPLAFVEPPSSSPSSPLGLVLATTHLYWDPQNEDVKHAQAEYLLHRMDQWMGRELGEGRGRFPVVLAGDFNSLPSSSVYRFITEGHISATDLPAWTAAGAPRLKDVGMDSFAISYLEGPHCHGLSLKSAYGARAEGEPGFTNYTPNWQGTIDYIFFSPPLRCGSVLPFPSIEEVSEEAGGLPNSQHASDHLPLLAELFIQ